LHKKKKERKKRENTNVRPGFSYEKERDATMPIMSGEKNPTGKEKRSGGTVSRILATFDHQGDLLMKKLFPRFKGGCPALTSRKREKAGSKKKREPAQIK